MPRSEIDDIFASTAKHPTTSSSISTPRKKKKKDKKRKRQAPNEDADHEEKPPKRPAPQTVLDPSSTLSVPAPKSRACSVVAAVKPKTGKKQREELEEFKDSRGSGPRRKTEEGFTIYKEAELGIDVDAGDTPLCPFDCDCCF